MSTCSLSSRAAFSFNAFVVALLYLLLGGSSAGVVQVGGPRDVHTSGEPDEQSFVDLSSVACQRSSCCQQIGPLDLRVSTSPITKSLIAEVQYTIEAHCYARDVHLTAALPAGAHLVYQTPDVPIVKAGDHIAGSLFISFPASASTHAAGLAAWATIDSQKVGSTTRVVSNLVSIYMTEKDFNLPPLDTSGPVPVRDLEATYR